MVFGPTLTPLDFDGGGVSLSAGLSGARQFTAADSEYFTASDNAIVSMGGTDFTISCWVYLDSIPGAQYDFFSHWTTAGNQRSYLLQYRKGSQNAFRWLVSNNGTSAEVVLQGTTPSPALTGTWYFCIADVDDGTDAGLQVNGFDETRVSSTAVHNSTGAFSIGADSEGVDHLDGRMTGVGVWKRLLTPGEKTWLYNSGAGRIYTDLGVAGTDGSDLKTGLQVYYDCDESSGDLLDAHTNSYNLTDTNGVTSADGPAA